MQAGVATLNLDPLRRIILTVALLVITGCSARTEDVFIEEEYVEDGSLIYLEDYFDQPSADFALYEAPVELRGIYVSAPRAGSSTHMEELLELCETAGINAMVIDVRTEEGIVTFKDGIQLADEMEITVNYIPDIRQLIETLRENNIYPIARVVAFKDNANAETRPDLYIKNKDGTIWRDPQQNPWLNPYNKDSWDFVLEFAKGAAELGFKEIQFDYIRFAASQRLEDADFGIDPVPSRTQIIKEFCQYAVDELRPYGVKVSADVYGTIINSDGDAEIVGQDYAAMAGIMDVICPMVYPSHYANNTMGIDIPDTHPYEIIYETMKLSDKRMETIPAGEPRAAVRPWIQDFTATWLPEYLDYGPEERRAQINALYDSGIYEWLLWDAGVSYEADGVFLPGDGQN